MATQLHNTGGNYKLCGKSIFLLCVVHKQRSLTNIWELTDATVKKNE